MEIPNPGFASLSLCLSFLFHACKKFDLTLTEIPKDQLTVTAKFFAIPADSDPLEQRIVAEIKKRNNLKEFVEGFAANNGYPIWNKTITAVVARGHSTENVSNSAPTEDTLVYIPFVEQDSSFVNGYILAKINNGIGLRYSLAQDYKAFTFAASNNEVTADVGSKWDENSDIGKAFEKAEKYFQAI